MVFNITSTNATVFYHSDYCYYTFPFASTAAGVVVGAAAEYTVLALL